jgi:hypothetical protein
MLSIRPLWRGYPRRWCGFVGSGGRRRWAIEWQWNWDRWEWQRPDFVDGKAIPRTARYRPFTLHWIKARWREREWIWFAPHARGVDVKE